MMRFQQVHSPEQIAQVARLAREVWTEHYVPIIGRDQVEYMLEHFQSERAVAEQLGQSYEYYLALHRGRSAGYLAVVPDGDGGLLMLSKLYVRKPDRGLGLGKQMLQFVEDLGRERALRMVWLTVNKHNTHSIAWYTRMGFCNAGAIVQDIGGGFVMDDFRLEKPIAAVAGLNP